MFKLFQPSKGNNKFKIIQTIIVNFFCTVIG